jgi:cell division septum initiation protein DivIVA
MSEGVSKKEEGSSGGAVGGESLWSLLPRSRRGYEPAATEMLFRELVSKHASLERECGKLREQAAALEADLARHRRQEQLVTTTLLEATSHATTIRQKAREEAESILRNAHVEKEERAKLAERIKRERSDAEQELVRLRELAQEVQAGLAAFLTQTLEQLRSNGQSRVPDPERGAAQESIESSAQAATSPAADRFPSRSA